MPGLLGPPTLTAACLLTPLAPTGFFNQQTAHQLSWTIPFSSISSNMGNTQSAVTSCGRPDVAKELLRAAEAGDVQVISSMLQADGRLLLHYSVFGGNSVWHKAAKGGHAALLEALELAVKKQYEQDNKDVYEVLKPSITRLGSSAAEAVTRLINKANVKGFTPLMLACSGNHTEAVAWLIKHGACHYAGDAG